MITMNNVGRMPEHQGEDDLHRHLHGMDLGAVAALLPLLRRMGPQHTGNRHPVVLGLDHGMDELAQLGDC
jgi:hypothetical protein